MDRSHTPIVLQENTQKSIENMNFELKRSILPQFQSPLKFIFSTNNIPQKIGIFLVYLFELCSKSKKKNDNMMTKSRKTTFFDSYIREGNEIEHTIFG